MAKFSQKSKDMVKSAMKRRKNGTLRSGSGKKVRSRKQAIAIGLSEARQKGAKVPTKKKKAGSLRSAAKRKSQSRKTARKNSRKKSRS